MIGVHLDWGELALYALALCFIYIPFAYKFARDAGDGRIVSILHVLILYILVCLWVGAGGLILFGVGMVIDRPDASCGVGCIEAGQAHWGGLKIGSLVLGLGLALAAWLIDKGMGRFIERYRAKRAAAVDLEHHCADLDKMFEKLIATNKQIASWHEHRPQIEARESVEEMFEAAVPDHAPQTEEKDVTKTDAAGCKSAAPECKSDTGLDS